MFSGHTFCNICSVCTVDVLYIRQFSTIYVVLFSVFGYKIDLTGIRIHTVLIKGRQGTKCLVEKCGWCRSPGIPADELGPGHQPGQRCPHRGPQHQPERPQGPYIHTLYYWTRWRIDENDDAGAQLCIFVSHSTGIIQYIWLLLHWYNIYSSLGALV